MGEECEREILTHPGQHPSEAALSPDRVPVPEERGTACSHRPELRRLGPRKPETKHRLIRAYDNICW
jgi:hypothetical protein